LVASDIRDHLSDAFRYLDPAGETPVSANKGE